MLRGRSLLALLATLAVLFWGLSWRSSHDERRGREVPDLSVDYALLSPEEAVPGEVVIDVVDWAGPDILADIGRRIGSPLVPVGPLSEKDKIELAHVEPGRMGDALRMLAGDPHVEACCPNFIYRALFEPNDPRFKEQWNLVKVKAPDAWDITTGKGVTVAVIDTGVAYENHGEHFQVEDLAGIDFVKGFNFLTGQPHGNDDNGHGTHVAGTIAQATNNGIGVAGIAHRCRIMPLKVLSRGGSGTVGHIAQAIRYAADNGAKVINMSLGGRFPARVMEQACEYAKQRGVIIICAAGNERRDSVGYPAGYSSCVAVSAIGPEDELAFYSNYGDKVAIAAPGGDKRFGEAAGILQNTINPSNPKTQGYFSFQGTSMAAPHVAGAAALVISLGVSDPDRVLKVLQAGARKKDDPRKFGAGILDCHAAVRMAKISEDWWRLAFAFLMGSCAFWWAWSPCTARVWPTPGFLAGLVIGSCGFFFAPLFGWSGWPFIGFLTAGFPQWDIQLLGAESHANPLFYSVMVPMILAVLFFGVSHARRTLAGFSVGVGAHLTHAALFGLCEVQGCLGLNRVWLLANATFCLLLAVVLIRSVSSTER